MADPLLDLLGNGAAPASPSGGGDPLLQLLGTSAGASTINPAAAPHSQVDSGILGAIASLGAGAGKGFGSTMLGAQKLLGQGMQKVGLDSAGNWLVNDANQGRAKLTAEADPYAQAHPIATGTGEVGGSIVATLPVGGVLARGVAAIPGVANTSRVVNAIRTVGMSTGAPTAATLAGKAADLGVRSLGGAITGGASSALVNQDDAGTGALIGAALPGVMSAAPVVGNLASRAAGKVGSAVADLVGELGTHTGGQPLKDAYRAGVSGGTSFIDNLRGNVPLTDVLDTAKANLQSMSQQAQQQYRQGMAGVSGDKTVLGFDGIDNALKGAQKIGTYKGEVVNPSVQAKVQDVADAINAWKGLDPADFHTPEGIDALKKSIGGILETIPFEQKSARLAVGNVYNAIKDTIADQAPTYNSVMKGYANSADQIKEVERALSLGNQASADTAMRKLQSLMRNNVNTNYGNRLQLAQALEQQGGNQIMPALAGQALSSLTPRGLGKAVSGANALYAMSNPFAAAALPLQSPRLMGELAYGLGSAQRGAQAVASKVPTNLLSQFLYRGLPPSYAAIDNEQQ